MDLFFGFIPYWDTILVGALAVVALLLLVRKLRKGSCDCGSCSKNCPARKFKER